MAARTADEILTSFKKSASLSDPTVDTSKGPLYSLVGFPLAQVLAPVEANVANLELIYSSQFALTADSDDAQAFLTNWGESAGDGTPASVQVFFMTFTAPTAGNDINIPIGTLVGNSDESLQFITIAAGTISGDLASTFYNPARRSYEIGIECQAVANGAAYSLPAGRIKVLISNVPGIDTVENRVDATPGALAETIPQQVTRVQQKFTGLAINTANGSYSRITSFAPTSVLDVQTITSSDRTLFKRVVYGPAKDCYISGSVPKTVTQTYTARGGESTVPITFVPAISVNSVTINQVPITSFTLIPDSTSELQFSAKANDLLGLSITLQPGDVVSFSVTYNSLIQDIQTNVLSDQQLFFTDELARQFLEIPIVIVMTGRALAGYDPVTVQNDILTVLSGLIPQVWTESFSPQDFFNAVKQNVPGATNLQLVTFQRSSQATSNLEVVLMNQNELATFDTDFVSVQISNV